MADVFDVAEYIIALDRRDPYAPDAEVCSMEISQADEVAANDDEPQVWPDVTPMKLQKLIYYVKGFSLVLLGRAIFPEMIEAWRHGPVCPDLYHRVKKHGSGVLSPGDCGGNISNLTDEEKDLIGDVYAVYGDYSASRLRNLTHNETPWQNAIDSVDVTITNQMLQDFFPALVLG